MTYDEFKSIIFGTSPEEWTYNDDIGRYVYKHNIAITIEKDRDRDQRFYEDWIKIFPNRTAYNERFFLQYNGITIEPFYCVSVDGMRAYLPFPNLDAGTVDSSHYNLVSVLNRSERKTIDYLKTAGFNVDYE